MTEQEQVIIRHFLAKPKDNGETVYVLADEFERFKELFLGEE